MTAKELLVGAVERGASDIYIVAGHEVTYRVDGNMYPVGEKVMPDGTEILINELFELAGRDRGTFHKTGDDDFAVTIPNLSRYRVSAFMQRGSMAAVIRVITFSMPDPQERNIPEYVMSLASLRKGLVLVTGPAGSGKSTTLACIIDAINKQYSKHIITLEDPVEYLHRHDKCIISQREINMDTESYATALRAALRQTPDVILLGEMRDFETISIAMTAAETGHLLFSTLHTVGAANTIDRIIDVFPVEQQRQITIQLSLILNCVISQQLVPSVTGKKIAAFEIMTVTPAIRNMIRDNKTAQIEGLLYSSSREDMISMDQSLYNLWRTRKITRDTALQYAVNPELLEKRLK